MSQACERCQRRRRLLGSLSARLDYRARDPERFWRLLELDDRELIDAIGGRRREELHSAYATTNATVRSGADDVSEGANSASAGGNAAASTNDSDSGIANSGVADAWAGSNDAGARTDSVCRHSRMYPPSLTKSALAPRVLAVRGSGQRLAAVLREPVVAIVGTRRATDYGMETARALARGLTACGVTVASGLAEGVAAAAHTGALEAGGPTLTVLAGGLDRSVPASCRALHRRILGNGCAISEAPDALPSRYWGELARARTLALLVELTIVVEAEERPWELAGAHLALALGKPLSAVPGRLTSPASKGTNALLMSGAHLVRDPRDVLDLLYGAGAPRAPWSPGATGTAGPEAETELEADQESQPEIEPRLRAVLDRVGGGEDTLPTLAARDSGQDGLMLALVELELQGLLVRGDGGRYVVGARALGV